MKTLAAPAIPAFPLRVKFIVAAFLATSGLSQAVEQPLANSTTRIDKVETRGNGKALNREQIDAILRGDSAKDSHLGENAGSGPAIGHPADNWEVVFESGYLWNIGNNTAIDYEIAPTQLTFRSPTVLDWFKGDNGSRLIVRSRFSILGESIVEGPEDYYIGINGAPSIEYWFPNEKTSLFFSIGGGVGWTNSTRDPEGQGQDFTLNWFSQLGLRQEIAPNLSVLGGAYFIHHSNGGQTDPNPGIDALGFTVGLGWQF